VTTARCQTPSLLDGPRLRNFLQEFSSTVCEEGLARYANEYAKALGDRNLVCVLAGCGLLDPSTSHTRAVGALQIAYDDGSVHLPQIGMQPGHQVLIGVPTRPKDEIALGVPTDDASFADASGRSDFDARGHGPEPAEEDQMWHAWRFEGCLEKPERRHQPASIPGIGIRPHVSTAYRRGMNESMVIRVPVEKRDARLARARLAVWIEDDDVRSRRDPHDIEVPRLEQGPRGYYFLADGFLRNDDKEYLRVMDQGVKWGERAMVASSSESTGCLADARACRPLRPQSRT
jgi:hypothetical protein